MKKKRKKTLNTTPGNTDNLTSEVASKIKDRIDSLFTMGSFFMSDKTVSHGEIPVFNRFKSG